ncbi:T9SS type A sorting domain-containing protein [Hymenobacter sp. B81]|uniref:T9SS type A sorting domain-containing protein n=1 Tax=Hymenobacter sp. B81 TaxID=3344878 RepID=UPI0037DC5BAB
MNHPLLAAGLLAASILGMTPAARAQPTFWRPTPTAPYGPKRGLVATGDSTLLTAVEAGVLRTTNQGRSWQLALRTRHAHALYARAGGRLLVGGQGKVYRSFDAGATWDSVALNTTYPVVSIAETRPGGLLVGTGSLAQQDPVGDGVFYSADDGQSWTARSTGFGAARYVGHLVVDRNGRAYATADSQERWRNPGLYLSDDQGQTWRHAPVRLDGFQFAGRVDAYETSALSITPQDSLLFSFSGGVPSLGVDVNLRKSLADVADDSRLWTVHNKRTGSGWWLQTPIQRVFFARNGDWYSSITGTPSFGGTLYSSNQGRSWQLTRSGVGVSPGNYREPQTFVELPDGKVFMVQDADPQVYWTTTSVFTSGKSRVVAGALGLFPNPSTDQVQLRSGAGPVQAVSLLDARGRCVYAVPVQPAQTTLQLHLGQVPAGVYLLRATLADGRLAQQRLVRQP